MRDDDIIARCPHCNIDLRGKTAISSTCKAPYEAWKQLFDPGNETKVILVGLAPPIPTARPTSPAHDSINYLYRYPDEPMPEEGTARLLFEGLRCAILDSPLEKECPHLARFYRGENLTQRGRFLEALRNDGIVWDDCVMHPIPTERVYRLVRNKDYRDALSLRLANRPFQRMVFLSASRLHRLLSLRVEERLAESGKKPGKALYVFETSFWPGYDGASWKEAQQRRSLEFRKGLSCPLFT